MATSRLTGLGLSYSCVSDWFGPRPWRLKIGRRTSANHIAGDDHRGCKGRRFDEKETPGRIEKRVDKLVKQGKSLEAIKREVKMSEHSQWASQVSPPTLKHCEEFRDLPRGPGVFLGSDFCEPSPGKKGSETGAREILEAARPRC